MMSPEQVRAAGGAFDPESYYRYMDYRSWFEEVFALVSKPIKFPSPTRRRRSDREIPKAA